MYPFQFAVYCACLCVCICVYDDGAVAVCHEILASLTTSFRRELAQIIARILTSNGNESFSSSLLWVEAHRNPSSSSSWVLGQRRWVRLGVNSIVYVHFWYFMYIFIKNMNVDAPARLPSQQCLSFWVSSIVSTFWHDRLNESWKPTRKIVFTPKISSSSNGSRDDFSRSWHSLPPSSYTTYIPRTLDWFWEIILLRRKGPYGNIKAFLMLHI